MKSSENLKAGGIPLVSREVRLVKREDAAIRYAQRIPEAAPRVQSEISARAWVRQHQERATNDPRAAFAGLFSS